MQPRVSRPLLAAWIAVITALLIGSTACGGGGSDASSPPSSIAAEGLPRANTATTTRGTIASPSFKGSAGAGSGRDVGADGTEPAGEQGGDGPAPAPAEDVAGRAVVDLPDDSGDAQIKVMYVLPADAADRRLDLDGTLARSIASTQAWLGRQTGGPKLRYDTTNGQLDIGFLRISRTGADMAATGLNLRDAIEAELVKAGFDKANKVYAVYYDGDSQGACGGGAWPPKLPGKVAAQYLRGHAPPPAAPCGSQPIGGSTTVPAYLDIAALHEIFHTLGAVAECAPNHTRAGHVAGDPNDFMYAGDQPWGSPADLILDIGRDDYWGHGRTDCLDLARSAFVDPRPADAQMPPGWPAGNAG